VNDKAAMKGSYADLKTIKTRSSVQMIVEFPIEAGAEIVRKFGFPQPGEEIPVAIARIEPVEEEPRRKSFAQQAKMLAKDDLFKQFVETKYGGYFHDADGAEQWIEWNCEVESCAEIIEGTEAGKKFKQLQAEFLNWRDAQEYAG